MLVLFSDFRPAGVHFMFWRHFLLISCRHKTAMHTIQESIFSNFTVNKAVEFCYFMSLFVMAQNILSVELKLSVLANLPGPLTWFLVEIFCVGFICFFFYSNVYDMIRTKLWTLLFYGRELTLPMALSTMARGFMTC